MCKRPYILKYIQRVITLIKEKLQIYPNRANKLSQGLFGHTTPILVTRSNFQAEMHKEGVKTKIDEPYRSQFSVFFLHEKQHISVKNLADVATNRRISREASFILKATTDIDLHVHPGLTDD